MTVPRRVRTQVERDADGTTWRPGGLVTGEPVRVELHPDDCVLVIREGVGVMCVRDHQQHDPDPDIWMTTEQISPPRRRWWHRYTRRT